MKLIGALLLPALVVTGCSFLLDFPEETSGQGGGGGGGGEGASGGTSCEEASVLGVVWRGAAQDATTDDYVTTTGLLQRGTSLLMYGSASSDFNALTFPETASNLLFTVEVDEDGIEQILSSVTPCEPTKPPDSLFSGRASLTLDRVFISGGLAAGQPSQDYGFNEGEVAVCGTDPVDVSPPKGINEAIVPFFAVVDDPNTYPDPSSGANAVTIDTTANAEVTAGIGITNDEELGDVFGLPKPSEGSVAFLSRSPETGGLNEVVFLSSAANADDFPRDLRGGIAVDDERTVWATTQSCPPEQSCRTSGTAVIALWPEGAAEAGNLSIDGTTSFGSSLRASGTTVVVGGGYQGMLSIEGEPFEPAPVGGDSFVAALDLENDVVAWTYPGPGQPPLASGLGFDAVVDLAIVEDGACGGAVYVTGCIVDQGAPEEDRTCTPNRTEIRNRHMYIAKLDLATGDLVWSKELKPEEPDTQLLLPTALLATGDGVMVAISFLGAVTLPAPTGAISSGAGVETLILKFAP